MIGLFNKKEKNPKDLESVVQNIKELEEKVKQLSKKVELLEKESFLYLKKSSMMRYNPFKEMGGDQSFSLVLLNGEDNGFIITSLQHKDSNRIYLKPVKKGKSYYPLSKEEEKVLKEAINSKEKSNGRQKS